MSEETSVEVVEEVRIGEDEGERRTEICNEFYLKPSTSTSISTQYPSCYSCHSYASCAPVVPVAMPTRTVIPEDIPHLPNFFGRIRERNLTFCLDTSGSMYRSLGAVKEQLCEYLQVLANHPLTTSFNLVEFSTDVTQWSDKMVTCTPQTVAVATEWIKGLEVKTGTNTMDALMTALCDERCDAIVLVTDGMPDQNPEDILDQVALVSGDRPIHCYYIRNGVDDDDGAVEFLRDMAMESYGSFHIVTVTQHGAIERITPIYRAEASAERIIRTTEGTIFPSNHRQCSIGTSLNDPVDYMVEKVGPDYIVETKASDVVLPAYTTTTRVPDSRYYYSYYYPYLGWSRYRPNKQWPKTADRIMDMATTTELPAHVSPGPGALLIGSKVLARRHADGYFYKGSVKSEIFDKKFLVEFGPCKHGKYKETSYQETYLYDILSLDDALRHSVMVGDKVLAPWEPKGERYAPGTVIEGQEKRHSDIGAGEESSLVVSLDHDGRSVKLQKGLALWIPAPFHERITFELKLPAKVRTEIATTEDYPLHSVPGYPRSGLVPFPEDYDRFQQVVVERDHSGQLEKGLYRAPYFVPLYPVHYKATRSAVRSEDVDEIIPGTGLTKDQLNEKVVQQLLEHKMMLEEIKRDQATLRSSLAGDKLLSKRDNIEETSISRKSVTFEDTKMESETKDSGHGSVADILSDLDLSDLELDDLPRDVACGGDTPMLTRRTRRTRKSGKLPTWKYWKSESSPSMMESNNYGKYRVGPFRECMMAAPLEAKQTKYGPYGEGSTEPDTKTVRFSVDLSRQGAYRPVPSITELTPSVLQRMEKDKKGCHVVVDAEWTSPMSRFVNASAVGLNDQVTVRDSMGYLPHAPHPPPAKVETQGPGVDISLTIGAQNAGRTEKAAARRNARRQRIIERERTLETRRLDKEVGAQEMLEQNRQRVLQQIRHDWQRVKDDQDRLQATRDAKRAISAELRTRVEEQRTGEQLKQEGRINARRARNERLESAKLEYQQAVATRELLRQDTKEQNQMRHWAKVNTDRLDREQQQAAQTAAKQTAQLQRIQHFRNLEAQGQANKMRQNQVLEQRNAMMRSSIFT